MAPRGRPPIRKLYVVVGPPNPTNGATLITGMFNSMKEAGAFAEEVYADNRHFSLHYVETPELTRAWVASQKNPKPAKKAAKKR